MNNKGVILYILGVAFVIIVVLPFLLMHFYSMSKILFQGILVFSIIGYVRQMGLDGALMWIVSGVLIYFIVFKYITLFTSLYVLMLLMGFGFTSAIMWGSNTLKSKITAMRAKG
jgi:hypothetical protein